MNISSDDRDLIFLLLRQKKTWLMAMAELSFFLSFFLLMKNAVDIHEQQLDASGAQTHII